MNNDDDNVQGPDREWSHHPVLPRHGSQAQGQGSQHPDHQVRRHTMIAQ